MDQKKQISGSPAQPDPRIMQMANELRVKANRMNDDQRMDSFRRGMQLIYGGHAPTLATKAGRP
jgi:hypothetical protein